METTQTLGQTTQRPEDRTDDGYHSLLEQIQQKFNDAVGRGDPLFYAATDSNALWKEFLGQLPEDSRAHYNCHNCRRFFEAYGNLVVVADDGGISSPIWEVDAQTPDFFAGAVAALSRRLSRSVVGSVFKSEVATLGTPVTGEWKHFSLVLPKNALLNDRLKTAFQFMAEKTESFGVLRRSLAEFSVDVTTQALRVVEANALARTEVIEVPLRWFHELAVKLKDVRTPYRDNLIWKAVAIFPPGMTHVRSNMTGTLLEDIVAGMPFEAVAARFGEKVAPNQYRRPQTAPGEGNVAQAEKIIETLGLKESLRRAWATMADVQFFWQPKVVEAIEPDTAGGVFSHLKTTKKEAAKVEPLRLPATTMTWRRFSEKVLPTANKIEYFASSRQAFFGLVTAAVPEAPPIVRWDHPEQRNPVSWYHHMEMQSDGKTIKHFGSMPQEFNLLPNSWHEVTGLSNLPCHWYGNRMPSMGESVLFMLKGTLDMAMVNKRGLMLFPETLISELDSVRKTLEAFSQAGTLEGDINQGVFGVGFSAGRESWMTRLRVTTDLGIQEVTIDRFE